jgi:glycine hydroxymethyltransferase
LTSFRVAATDNHHAPLDLVAKDITVGADAALGRAFITVNKTAVPNDPRSPFSPAVCASGTPASTTGALPRLRICQVADWICDILDHLGDESIVDGVRTQVKALCAPFPGLS